MLKTAEDLPNLQLMSWSVAPKLLMELPRYVKSSTVPITFRPMTISEAVWWSPTRIVLVFLLLTDKPSFPGASLIEIIIIIMTSFAPISSKIKISGATNPRD